MATATMTRANTANVPAREAAAEHTTGQKATAALVVGAATAVTLSIFGWAAWVTSQISIPL